MRDCTDDIVTRVINTVGVTCVVLIVSVFSILAYIVL